MNTYVSIIDMCMYVYMYFIDYCGSYKNTIHQDNEQNKYNNRTQTENTKL